MHTRLIARSQSRYADLTWTMLHVLKVYFAPVTGAIKGIRAEYRRLDEEAADRRRSAAEEPAQSRQ